MVKLKSLLKSFLICITIIFSLIVNAVNDHKSLIELKFIKNSDWSLTEDFLCNIASLSKADIFIESGTYLGATVANAKLSFKEVHSIELSDVLYKRAVQNFKNTKNVFLYNGNSATVLPRIIPRIIGKIVFWLDGHYSEGETARGDTDSPIVQELEAIRTSGLKNSIILIDDIRLFGIHPDYPLLLEVYKIIKSINFLYKIEVMGDILIAYSEDEFFEVSPVIKACTISRFAASLYTLDEILQAEQIITQVQGEDKDTLYRLNATALHNRYSSLWYGLICMHEQSYSEASQSFKKAQKEGLNHWRIFWYLGLNAYQAKWYAQARQYLTIVLEQAPFFEDALKMSKILSDIN